ncbi:MAG: AMP-binding protein, partial [Clostridia bacterium]|nr:AMP-binding protein [Clostridia bacterium]
MKLVFSTQNVDRGSFLDLCRFTFDYGYAGFEIYDALSERRRHGDSVLRTEIASDAKRKLHNRGLQVAALTVPFPLEDPACTPRLLLQYVDLAQGAGAERVLVRTAGENDLPLYKEKLADAVRRAEEVDVEILFETVGFLSETQRALEIMNAFSSAVLGVAWNVRETFFSAGESAENTIKTLGAYIRYVRLGDRKDGRDVLLGEGDLPVESFLNALSSLNYEGFVACAWNEDIRDPDIVLTHFRSFLAGFEKKDGAARNLQRNRAGTGTFPWKKYDTVDLTFSQVLDVMADTYPDQLAFKYTTLDYTRTYSQFRRDVDRVAAAFIAMGVKPGYHVAIWATNVPAWFLTFWAATKIGAVLVTVNTAYKIHEAEYLLRQSDTHTLVMIRSSKDSDYKSIMEELCPELATLKKGAPLYAARLPFLRNVVTVDFSMNGCMTWEEMLDLADRVPMEEVRR